MKKLLTIFTITLLLVSCSGGKEKVILPGSTGKANDVLVVTKPSLWSGELGDEMRIVFGEHLVGLPQPETLLSVGQVAPQGFSKIMKVTRNILVAQVGAKENFYVKHNQYSEPQTIIYLTATDNEGLVNQFKKHGKEIIKTFKEDDIKRIQQRFAKKRVDDSKYKTLANLGISLTIPEEFKTVDDTGDFLWLRQHLMSGIARGDGTNNILVYSMPLAKDSLETEDIIKMRDSIGEKYIPGSEEGMYMITEEAYTPHIFDAEVDGKKAYETRGKWEVKNDFMAGPFINYTVLDKKNNRLIIVEGFTYAPSINKRDFIFDLEAITRSLKIK